MKPAVSTMKWFRLWIMKLIWLIVINHDLITHQSLPIAWCLKFSPQNITNQIEMMIIPFNQSQCSFQMKAALRLAERFMTSHELKKALETLSYWTMFIYIYFIFMFTLWVSWHGDQLSGSTLSRACAALIWGEIVGWHRRVAGFSVVQIWSSFQNYYIK